MVETYLLEETESLIHDPKDLAKWQEMVSELGLEGQVNMSDEGKSPVPFVYMNDSMTKMYETLCPRKIGVSEYNKTPIPIKVLSLIALSQKEEYFDKMEVWIDDKEPDPVLVGFIYKNGNQWDTDKYCIARWGDELRSMIDLKNKAIDRLSEKYELEIAEAKAKLDSLTGLHLAKKYLSGNYINISASF